MSLQEGFDLGLTGLPPWPSHAAHRWRGATTALLPARRTRRRGANDSEPSPPVVSSQRPCIASLAVNQPSGPRRHRGRRVARGAAPPPDRVPAGCI